MAECVFCQIAGKKAPAGIVYEDSDFAVFKDIRPKAETHLLIVPKKHIESVNHLLPDDVTLAGKLLLTAGELARQKSLDKAGYKLVFNVGRGGGQLIDHLHLHLLSGKKIALP